jgi:hypothetical protein
LFPITTPSKTVGFWNVNGTSFCTCRERTIHGR